MNDNTPTTSYIEAPAAEVIAWCEAKIGWINQERERLADEAIDKHLAWMQDHRTRWMSRLPRWVYNPPEPQRDDAVASLEAEDSGHVLCPGPLYWAQDFGWKAKDTAQRLLALARTASKIGSPVFLTAEDHRYIAPR